MKRSAALQPLSREHHQALVLAKACERAAKSGDAQMIGLACARVQQAFAAELEPHFQTEERMLLPCLLTAGQQALVQHTEDDHRQLRALHLRIQQQDLNALAEHVRFEERELFPACEQWLPEG